MIHDMEYYRYYEITEEGVFQKKSVEEKIVKYCENFLKSKFMKGSSNIKVKFLNERVKEDGVSYKRVGLVCTYTNSEGKKDISDWNSDDFHQEVDINKLKELAKASDIIKPYL